MPDVANHLVGRMRDAGTRTLFGLPGGGGNLDLIEAAGRAGLPFVLTATETGSAIAAIAQAEITGAPGACITTLGPGAASVVNGVACAKLERAPLLVITDNQATGAVFEHQGVDQRALLGSLVKWSGTLAPHDGASQNMNDAFDRLAELPPGPVHLDCPADFEQAAVSVLGRHPVGTVSVRSSPPGEPAAADYAAFRKPLLLVGLGARRPGWAAAIRELCETTGIPALVTYKAKGVVPDGHPWFAGVFTHGAIERPVIDECDLIIGVGCDPVEILPRPWNYRPPVISIASWEMPVNHVPFRHQYVSGDAGAIRGLGRLLTSEWNQEVVQAHAERSRREVLEAGPGDPDRLTAQAVVVAAASRWAGRARVTVDAGAHMFPATMLWPATEPNEMLISNGLSTMGFALPAAIGAGLLDRDRPVIALTGDGGLLICMGELATLARERLRVIVIVFKDDALSLIEIKQQARHLAPKGVALGEIDWVRIAEGFGLAAWKAASASQLDDALAKTAAADGPCLIEASVDPSNYPATMKAIRG